MATKGFDDLLDFLLLEIAFRGLQGATVEDFAHFVNTFYKESAQDGPRSINGAHSATADRAVTDRELLRRIWTWLAGHPDISIGENRVDNGLSFDEAEQRELSEEPNRQGRVREIANAEASPSLGHQAPTPNPDQMRTVEETQPHESPPQLQNLSNDARITQRNSPAMGTGHSEGPNGTSAASHLAQKSEISNVEKTKTTKLRIYASHERIWRALAGHDVDWRRVPKMELDLLSIIAAGGPNGVLQGALVRSSGQDKRSVPHRTDRLHANGYISKQKIMANSNHTSLCIHQRFAQNNAKGAGIEVFEDPETHAIFKDGFVFYGQLFKSLFTNLRAHNNIMTLQDIRRCLGIQSNRHKSKLFYRLATRLEKLGVLQRVKARAENSTVAERRFRCLKVLREPSEEDFRDFVSFGRKQNHELNERSEFTLEQQNDIDDLFPDNDEVETVRAPPQWTPDIPHANFLFNLIHSGGTQGLVSKDLQLRAIGIFWRRPLDTSLGRLSDVWELAQPQNLRHLAIIRDTIQVQKGAQYVYRTYPTFQAAVNEGQAEWEAVLSSKTSATSKNERTEDQASVAPSVESLGFSPIPDQQFVSSHGTATLSECERQAKIKKEGLTSSDPYMKIFENGTIGIDWGSRGSFSQSRRWNRSDLVVGFPQIPSRAPSKTKREPGGPQERKRGRPRKRNGPTDRKEARARKRKAMQMEDGEDGGEGRDVDAIEHSLPPKRNSHEADQIEGKPVSKRSKSTKPSRQPSSTLSKEIQNSSNAKSGNEMGPNGTSTRPMKSIQGQGGQKPPTRPSRKRKRPSRPDSSPDPNLGEQSDNGNPEVHPKVRINPPGSERPYKRSRRGRRPKSLIIVINVDRLRCKDWSDTLLSKGGAQNGNSSESMIMDTQQGLTNDSAEGSLQNNMHAANLPERPNDMKTPKPSSPTEETRRSYMPPNSPLAPRTNTPETPYIDDGLTELGSNLEGSVNPPTQPSPRATTLVEPKLAHSNLGENSQPLKNTSRTSHTYLSHDASRALRKPTPQEDVTDVQMLDVRAISANVQGRARSPVSTVARDDLSADRLVTGSRSCTASKSDVRADYSVSLEEEPVNNGSSPDDIPGAREPSRYSPDYRPLGTGAEWKLSEHSEALNHEDNRNPSSNRPINKEIAKATEDLGFNRNSPSIIPNFSVDNDGKVAEGSSEIQNEVSATSHRKRGVAVSEGFVGHSRAKTILQIIKQAGGVFPGGNAIWYPFMTIWGDNPDGTQVERRTLSRVVKNLVERDRLRKITFIFKDRNGAVVTRHVLALPDEDPTSGKVREIQKRISDAHPFQFLPPGVEVSEELKISMKRTLRGSFEPGVLDGVLDSLSSRVHSQASAALADHSISDIPDTGNVATENAHRAQETEQSAREKANLSKSYKVTSFRSQASGFQNDDTITVRRLFQPVSDALEQSSTPSGAMSKGELKSAHHERKPAGRPKKNTDLTATSISGPTFYLHRRASNHSRLRQKDALNVADFSNPAGSSDSDNGHSGYYTDNEGHDDDAPPDGTLIFINKSPASFNPDYGRTEMFSLLNPDQIFYTNTGTFSTESSVIRNARLDLWENLDTQDAFEQDMPYNIEDVVSLGSRLCKYTRTAKGRRDTSSGKIDLELLCVRKWEESVVFDEEWQQGYGDRKLRAARFMNHRVPYTQAFERPGQITIDWNSKENEHFTLSKTPYMPLVKGGQNRLNSGRKAQSSSAGPKPWHDADDYLLTHVSAWQGSNHSSLPEFGQSRHQALRLPQPGSPLQALHGNQGILVPERQPTGTPAKPLRRGRVRKVSSKTLPSARSQDVLLTSSLSQHHHSPTGSPDIVTLQTPSLTLDTVEKRNLMEAVAVVRSLTSGSEQQEIQWGLVAQACGYMHDGLTLRRCWKSYRSKKITDEFQERFQVRFVDAYEKGELPELDFTNLESYDWAWLLDWARKADVEESNRNTARENLHQIPLGGRDALGPTCSILEGNEDSVFSERFYSVLASAPYRDAMVNRSVFLFPSEASDTADLTTLEMRRKYTPTSDLDIAPSWIRANCLTPSASFDGQVASRKLRELTETTISVALDNMTNNRILRVLKNTRLLPGRNYDLTDFFLSSFRRPLELKHFNEAARYKERLDTAFQGYDVENTDGDLTGTSELGVLISPIAEDGEVLAILNLLATGQVKLAARLPPITDNFNAPDPKLLTWGMAAPGYQTTQMDRKKLGFDLEVHPTGKYAYGNPLKDRRATKKVRTPPSQEATNGRAPIPLWYDINGECLPEAWNMVLVAILASIVTRAGADVDTIVQCCKGNLERWEALLCLEWCEAVGALRRIGSGWTTQDWWWLAAADDMRTSTE